MAEELIKKVTRDLNAAGYELVDVLDPNKRFLIHRVEDIVDHQTLNEIDMWLYTNGVHGELPPKHIVDGLTLLGLTDFEQRRFHTLNGLSHLQVWTKIKS